MLSFVLSAVLLWQEPDPADKKPPQEPPKAGEQGGEKPPAAEPEPPRAPAQAVDDRAAKTAIAEFLKVLKGKPGMGERQEALKLLDGSANKQFVKPLQKFIEDEKSIVLRRAAIEALADQPADAANPALRKLLKNARVTTEPQVHAGLIRGIARCGYEPKQWAELAEIFESDYDTSRVPVHEAILQLVAEHKDKQALPLLLRNLDEPSPQNKDAPNNPPAEYWKARWHSWAAWKLKVKEALFAITGQNFTTSEEALNWLKKNPLK